MRVECQRCGAISNTTDKEGHLCKDLAKRYERQAKAVDLIMPILQELVDDTGGVWLDEEHLQNYALEIIKAIGARDNGL